MQAAKEVAGLAEPEPRKKKKKRSKPKTDALQNSTNLAKPSGSGSGSAPVSKPAKKKSSKKPLDEQDQVRERAAEPKPSRDNEHRQKTRSRKHKSRNRSRSRHRNPRESRRRPLEDQDQLETNPDQDEIEGSPPGLDAYPSGAIAPDIDPEYEIQAPEGYPTPNTVDDNRMAEGDRLEDRFAEQPGPIIHNSNPVIENTDSEVDAPSENERPSRRRSRHRRSERKHRGYDSHHTESGAEGGPSEDFDAEDRKKRKSSKRRGKKDKHKRERRDRRDRRHRDHAPRDYPDEEVDRFASYPSGGHLTPHPDLPVPPIPLPLGAPVGGLTRHGQAYIAAQQENMRREQEEELRRREEEELRHEEEYHMQRNRRTHSHLKHSEHHHRHSRSCSKGSEKRKSHRSHHEPEYKHAEHYGDEAPVIEDDSENDVYVGTRGVPRTGSQRSMGSGGGSGVLGKIKSAASGLKSAVKEAAGIEDEDKSGEGRFEKSESQRSRASPKSRESEEEANPMPDIDDGSDGTAPSGGEQSPHEVERLERRKQKSKDRPRRNHSKKDTKKHGGRHATHRKKYTDRRDPRNEKLEGRPRFVNEDDPILAEERALSRRRSRKHQVYSGAEEERIMSRHRSKQHRRHGHDADTLDSLSSRRAREVMRGTDASPTVTLSILERFLPGRSVPELKKAKERAEEEGFLELPEMGENESLAQDALVREAKTSAFRVQVPQNFSYIVERWSKYNRRLDAGWHVLLPFIDRVSFVHSLKEEPMTIPSHQSFTRDSVPVHTAGMLFVKVTDPLAASYEVENPYRSLLLLAQACVTQSVGKRLLRDAMNERPELGKSIVDEINDQARTWGLWVSRVELTELEPPPETRAMLQYEGEAHMQTGLEQETTLRNDYIKEADEETRDELTAIYKTHNAASRIDENISQGSELRNLQADEDASQGGDSKAERESRGGGASIGSGWQGSRVDEAQSQGSAVRAPTIRSESETTYDPFLDDAVSEHAVLGASWFTGATAARRAGSSSEAGADKSTGTWEGLPPNRFEAGARTNVPSASNSKDLPLAASKPPLAPRS